MNKEQQTAVNKLAKWRKSYKTQKDMHEILPGLYLGTCSAATNKKNLQKASISAILTIMTAPVKKEKNVKYKQIHLEDEPQSDLSQYFGDCIDFIHSYRVASKNVLVHCLMGVSRSATIVTAYIMTITKMDPTVTIRFIRSRRDVVNPNNGFCEQLEVFKDKLEEQHDDLEGSYRRFKDDHVQLSCDTIVCYHWQVTEVNVDGLYCGRRHSDYRGMTEMRWDMYMKILVVKVKQF
ncbi:unnamed protein product [Bursaphelenchus okinawaensis]|uniref:Protein-tyrosine-phosphatase n=1 Tax=Bursaphelenchus okinawaensis TaxID=465554 RepID=A0A811KKB1_9BILA|nr:unnamed protein product [Bursaphelenchus okinawaensis]CAG9105452.1 unnamed protein product [Bursaphelenchus okinawaensis]